MNSTSNNNNNNNKYVKLLQQFPKIKFSYELKSYKKVSTTTTNSSNGDFHNENNSIYFIVPKGKKYFVWFKNDECLFLELDNDKQVVNVMCKKTSYIFPNDTILYGTHFYYRAPMNANSNSIVNIQYYFTIENIHYYNGVNLDATHTVFEKCKTLHLAFTTVTLEKTFQINIGLPHIDTCIERISAVKPFYNVYCIQKKNANDTKNQYQNIYYQELSKIQKKEEPKIAQEQLVVSASASTSKPVITGSKMNTVETKKHIEKTSNNYKIFIVSADIQNDIYHLVDPQDFTPPSNYTSGSNNLIASIPDYKTSVMMNTLFRDIKENRCLDALEESDDEKEFENTNIDKFVDLTKKIKMKCIFNYKFKKWTPVECVN